LYAPELMPGLNHSGQTALIKQTVSMMANPLFLWRGAIY